MKSEWDNIVADAVAAIVDEGIYASTEVEQDSRAKLRDQSSGRTLLLDSGASKSVWPRSDFPSAQPDQFKALKAVNNTVIKTFGEQVIKVQVSKTFTFTHTFTLAEIKQPIAG